MKKYICILASAALFAACEQKTETAAPAAPDKTENNTTIVNPSPAGASKSETHTTIVNPTPAEKKSETTNTTNINTTAPSTPAP